MKQITRQIGLNLLFLIVSLSISFAQKTTVHGYFDGRIELSQPLSSKSDTGIFKNIARNAPIRDSHIYFVNGNGLINVRSDINDRFDFIGDLFLGTETSALGSPTFTIAIQRAQLQYNIYGNHNLRAGKLLTPTNFWNTLSVNTPFYFPSVLKPALFNGGVVMFSTTGLALNADNLGKLKFGYDLMIGNGIGANDYSDNDKHKTLVAAVRIKPLDLGLDEGLRLGASISRDVISKGASSAWDTTKVANDVYQTQIMGSTEFKGYNLHVLGDYGLIRNYNKQNGDAFNHAFYVYCGYTFFKKLTYYVRTDQIIFEKINNDDYFITQRRTDLKSYVTGLRYEPNINIRIKAESNFETFYFYRQQTQILYLQRIWANLQIAYRF